MTRIAAVATGLMLAACVRPAEAQQRPARVPQPSDSVFTAAPGPQYDISGFRRSLFGENWRELWATPVTAPVLHLDSHLGGLKLLERGGNTQSLVLHLQEQEGWREYRFRSVDKFPMMAMPATLKGTAAGRFLQDQVSVYFPAAPIMAHHFLRAIGALTYEADLYVLADSPILGVLSDTVPGLHGTFEIKPDEGPDDAPGFAGSTAVKGSDNFLEDLASGREHRLDEREFLAVRLVDILMNDPDRSRDNFDWARFGEKGNYTWRPVARDRDQAFMDARGLVNSLIVRRVFPKQVAFDEKIPLTGLTYITHVVDRRLLQRLTAEDFRAEGERVRRAITDSVIAAAIAELPREWREGTDADERLGTTLRARRDQLPDVAMRFYRDLATEVDVHGTDAADRVDVVRHADGGVTVTIGEPAQRMVATTERENDRVVTVSTGEVSGGADGGPWYRRTFLPSETGEVRIYTGGGDDVAVVRGAPHDAIIVRLIGDAGDDVLADSAGGGRTHLYDEAGSNTLIAGRRTRVDTRPWKAPQASGGWRLGGAWVPDWGRSSGWSPTFDYNTGAGVILGGGPRWKKQGFRRLPYHWQAGANFLVGTGNGRLGLTFDADYRAENSGRAFVLEAAATQLESTRFFGYGNTTPDSPSALSRVDQDMITLEPAFMQHIGWRSREHPVNPFRGEDTTARRAELRPIVGTLRVGPALAWISPQPHASSPLATGGVLGARAFGVAGARLALELDRTDRSDMPTRGWTLETDIAGYPVQFNNGGDAFGAASGAAAVYVPLVERGPHLAFRGGGSVASGAYPAQFAAAIGGRHSLRGYSWRRFAGDAAAHGSAELRVPVGTVNFLVRSQLGVFGLADAGRVWFDRRNDGGWHRSVGAGLWVSAFHKTFSVAYARGEEGRLYLSSGLFY